MVMLETSQALAESKRKATEAVEQVTALEALQQSMLLIWGSMMSGHLLLLACRQFHVQLGVISGVSFPSTTCGG